MGRRETRELIRLAQQAEIAGDKRLAAGRLAQAAEIHLEHGDGPRAAALLRHCQRLDPGREGLDAALARAEKAAALSPRPRPEPVFAGPDLPIGVVELDEARAALPDRAPVAADPGLDAWCSFCCRPRVEAGALVGGPTGAFVCSACARAALRLTEGGSEPGGSAPHLPMPSAPEAAREGFLDDAVRLGRELGWSLSEIRSLSDVERRRAVALLAPDRRRRGRKKPTR